MREVNFSIPNVNKASVGITTALYDRRALDCTSTLPLINSLNHLAYLTTSSARIRDILTVDGGIERLVCILKEGRSKDMMGMWKWNLAFQCVVNIGVRGTEGVRTRVVEADMVPVIATILENYINVIDKCREKAEEVKQKTISDHHARHKTHDRHHHHHRRSSARALLSGRTSAPGAELEPQAMQHQQRSLRRQAIPPSIDVSATYAGPSTAAPGSAFPGMEPPLFTPQSAIGTNSDHAGPSTGRPRHLSLNSDARNVSTPSSARTPMQSLSAAASMEAIDGLLRPVRDAERLASMAPFDITSQPTSPTTPLPPPQLRSPSVRPVSNMSPTTRGRRRPSIRHQNSTNAESDDPNGDSMASDESPDADMTGTGDMQTAVGIQDITMEDGDNILADASLDLTTPTVSETHQETGTFNITHRNPLDGSITTNTNNATPIPPIGLSPNRPTIVSPPQPQMPNTTLPRYLLDRHFVPNPEMLAAMPREEDVLMSLQLLAYVSKYCTLRSYFQKSHLVPRLRIKDNIGEEDADEAPEVDQDDDIEDDEEYLAPNDFNLFPLVEKFTVRYHSTDMQYWAGVVMRNLCRKDETRDGIRQCAYYQCGKWEKFPRQFAKCRRCRRTKYCSKECQKSTWAFHRHWCVAAASQ